MSRASIPRIATTLARVAVRATTTTRRFALATTTRAASSSASSSSSTQTSNRIRVVASASGDAGTRRRGASRGVVAVSRGSWSSAGRSVSTTTRAGAGANANANASANATASDLVEYLNDSWTAWHATEAAVEMLENAGYERISETAEWGDLRRNGKYYVTRNASALVAFAVGGAYEPGNGFNVVAAHTDSPCPKLKPVTKIEKGGFKQVGVQTYGGGLWHTWFDRDLSVAGRVLVKRGDALTHELVRIDRPIIRIPTLAIHLDREISTNGFKPNTETNFAPILATAIKGELEGEVSSASGAHHALLLAVLAEELGCAPEDIKDFELSLIHISEPTRPY